MGREADGGVPTAMRDLLERTAEPMAGDCQPPAFAMRLIAGGSHAVEAEKTFSLAMASRPIFLTRERPSRRKMSPMRIITITSITAFLACGAFTLSADTTAYVVPTGTVGNQFLPGNEPQSLGLDFNVNSAIYITSLGVFDSGSDGLSSSLTVHIYDRDTHLSLIELTFTPQNPGTPIAGSRFLTLDNPFALQAGFHGVIAVDYITANNEANGNRKVSPGDWTTDDGGDLISFVGTGRHSFMGEGAIFPGTIEDGNWPDVYASGTFTFVAVPEPSTLALLSLGMVGIGMAWRRKLKQ